ncbi:MAG TPA: DUF454 domain-containing protein [Myxococcales bacterium]|nr:DUF454 domain-containing protein [Myxococcales bacterium]
MAGNQPQHRPEQPPVRGARRVALLALGWLYVALGMAGAFLPVLPTTPFLLVSLWCFARTSQRFHGWLYGHPRFGPPLQHWHAERVIPVRVKVTALSAMALSLSIVVAFSSAPWSLIAVMAAVMACGAGFILTRQSHPASEPRREDPAQAEDASKKPSSDNQSARA